MGNNDLTNEKGENIELKIFTKLSKTLMKGLIVFILWIIISFITILCYIDRLDHTKLLIYCTVVIGITLIMAILLGMGFRAIIKVMNKD